MKDLYSRAITIGRKMQPRRRHDAAKHKLIRTMCNQDVPFIACLAVVVGGDFKRAVRLAL